MINQPLKRFVFPVLALIGSITANAQSQPKEMFWNPDFDQPIQQLEQILSELKQQQPMNYTIANISFLYDAKLLILFHKYLEKLPVSKRPAEVKIQNEWIDERWRAIQKESAEYEGGTMGSFATGELKIELTKRRIRAIEELLNGLRR